MPSRETLHDLIDTLPDGALESAQRVLRNYQTWPPKPPIDVERMHKRVEEGLRRRGEERAALGGTGLMGAHVSGSRFGPDGDGMSSMRTTEGETLVTFEIEVFRGHRLEIEERICLSENKKSLVYTQQIKGPDGKEGRYKIEFEVAESLPPFIDG
jgi:hypothetical protein